MQTQASGSRVKPCTQRQTVKALSEKRSVHRGPETPTRTRNTHYCWSCRLRADTSGLERRGNLYNTTFKVKLYMTENTATTPQLELTTLPLTTLDAVYLHVSSCFFVLLSFCLLCFPLLIHVTVNIIHAAPTWTQTERDAVSAGGSGHTRPLPSGDARRVLFTWTRWTELSSEVG